MTDAQLLRLFAQTRSDEAFAEVVRRHLPRVYSASLRRVGGDGHLAKDVSQTVFIALARNASKVADHPFITGWLHASTRNVAAKTVRGERRRRERERVAVEMTAASEPTPEAGWKNIAPALDASIDALSANERQLILMRFLEQQSHQEIATAFNLTEDAARMRVHRAVERLKELLERAGVTSTASALAIALTDNAVGAVPSQVAVALQTTGFAAASGPAAIAATVAGVLFSPVAAAVAVALAAVAAAGYETVQLQSARAAMTVAQANFDQAAAQMRVDEGRAKMAAQAWQAAAARSPLVSTVGGGSAGGSPAQAAGEAFLERHPEVMQALDQYVDGRNRMLYAGLFRSLNLSPEQIGKFLELKRAGWWMEQTTPLGFLDLGVLASPTAANNAAIAAVLGESGMQAYENLGVGARGDMMELADDLAFAGAPLSSAAAGQMQSLFRNAHADSLAGVDWDAVVSGVQGILSPPQMEQLQNLRQSKQDWTKVNTALATQ